MAAWWCRNTSPAALRGWFRLSGITAAEATGENGSVIGMDFSRRCMLLEAARRGEAPALGFRGSTSAIPSAASGKLLSGPKLRRGVSSEPPPVDPSTPEPASGLSFSKLLVANRGEIACRVMRTARKMGLKTVAVFSEADREALHVREADEAVCLAAASASSSYLSIDAIIAACKATGAQAVHPGYGFLSENAAFASALADAGINFVGPPASAIGAMGDKVESKRLAKDAGVNVIPGYVGVVADASEAGAKAREIGYPVMIKASAGGGGKGMRVAWSDEEVREGFSLATQEAMSSFGDGRILIEKFVEEPRHIEIQLIADKHGNCLWLPERECSIQRRNQKVVEEAPSSFIDPATRRAMGEQAVSLAKAVNYCSAGTVEFLVDKHRQFYFLEMNTRLQVEHPVTEAITGLDLVEEMLRVADGQPLAFQQERASKIHGWAVEARVYAEDPARGFLPSTGRLLQYIEPAGPGVRCDAGVTQGSDISMHYDPMISKLVTHGVSRADALSRMRSALDSYVVRGPEHNLPFLRAVLGHPAFESGEITTAFIQKHFPCEGDTAPINLELEREGEHCMSAVAALWNILLGFRMSGRSLTENVDMVVSISGRDMALSVAPPLEGMQQAAGDAFALAVVTVDGENLFLVEMLRPSASNYTPDLIRARVNGELVTMQVVKRRPRGALLQLRGAQREVKIQSHTAAGLEHIMPPPFVLDASKQVSAPMPGLIVDVRVEVGQKLQPGDGVMLLEAMKMRNTLRAENGGVVKAVHVSTGDTVSADQVLVEFE